MFCLRNKFIGIILVLLVSDVLGGPYQAPRFDLEDQMTDREMHPDLAPWRDHNQKIAHLMSPFLDELDNNYWLNNAKDFVEQQLKKTPNTKKAKNIILFLGDGMSIPTIAATRVYIGGESKKMSFEEFPFTAMSKTYCVDKQVADSACTATAYLSGVKANDATIGLNARATRSNCNDQVNPNMLTESIASWAMKAGKDAGFVTTTRVTHASPTGVYGHIADRDWENDAMVAKDGCSTITTDDIAEQLIYGSVGKQLKVIFGGGAMHFIHDKLTAHGKPGARTDGKDLFNEWLQMNSSRTFIDNKRALLALDPKTVQQVMGIFEIDHIKYNLDIQKENLQNEKPSLADMTVKAIEILSQKPEGFFLFVEGGRIDHGHHKNNAKYAIDETAEFSKAIAAAKNIVSDDDTLIVVTADHGHVMTLAGYGDRGNDIFGTGGKGTDNIPYMTLSYANGLGYYDHVQKTGGRVDPTKMDRSANDFKFPATVPADLETHGGEDVGIWATGPWSHLFGGTIEQNIIPHVMAYASCIGDGLKACDK